MCSAIQPCLLAQVGGDTQGEALLAQQHVSAVAGVDGHDGVLLGELDNVAVLRVDVGLGVEALDKVSSSRAATLAPTRVMMHMFSTT